MEEQNKTIPNRVNDRAANTTLFLLGALLAGSTPCQMELLLAPSLITVALKTASVTGSVLGVMFGFFICGNLIKSNGLRVTALLIPALGYGGAGLYTESVNTWFLSNTVWPGLTPEIRFLAPYMVFAFSFIFPFFIGLSIRIRMKSSSRRTKKACFLLGLSVGSIGFIALIHHSLGLSSSLQILSALAFSSLIPPLGPLTESPSHKWTFKQSLINIFGAFALFILIHLQLKTSPIAGPLLWGFTWGLFTAGLVIGLLARNSIRAHPRWLIFGFLCLLVTGLFLNREIWFPQNTNQNTANPSLKHRNQPSRSARIAWLSALLHPEPKDLLILGADSGVVTNELIQDPNIQTITWLSHSNKTVGSKKVVRIGLPESLYLNFSKKHFDMIVSTPVLESAPLSLFSVSKAFFNSVLTRLKPQGIFCQWIQPHRIPPELFPDILADFKACFPRMHVLCDHRRSIKPSIALVGVLDHLRFSVNRAEMRLGSGDRLKDFAEIGLNAHDLPINYITNGQVLDVRLPPDPGASIKNRTLISWPDRYKHNLYVNLSFLNKHQVGSYPVFKWDQESQVLQKTRSSVMSNAGRALWTALLKGVHKNDLNQDGSLITIDHMDLEEALILVRGVSSVLPYDFLINLILRKGGALKKEQGAKASIAFMSLMFQAAPGAKEFQLTLSEMLYECAQYEKALQVLEKPHSSNINDPEILASLAVIKAKLGDASTAVLLLRNLLTSEHGFTQWVRCALQILLEKKPEPMDISNTEAPLILRSYVMEHLTRSP